MLKMAIRVVVSLAIVGLLVHEGGQIFFAQTKASDIAQTVAGDAAERFQKSKNVSQARALAVGEVAARGGRLRRFTLEPDGRVTVTVVVKASTLIVRRVSFLRHFGVRRATETGSPPVL
jgi:hypothetical protein